MKITKTETSFGILEMETSFKINFKIQKKPIPELTFLDGKPREDTRYLLNYAYSPEYFEENNPVSGIREYRVYQYIGGYWKWVERMQAEYFDRKIKKFADGEPNRT